MTRAEKFRAAVEDRYDLSPADLAWLEETVEALATIDEIREALKDEPLMVTGQGGPRVHPLRVELRLMQQTAMSLLRKFPDVTLDDEEA